MKRHGYEIRQIDGETWSIEDDFVRAFLLVGEEQALLIDSTNGTGDVRAVIGELTDRPVLLVNTHADADHIGCNAQLDSARMHPAEFAYYAVMKKPLDPAPLPVWEGEIIELGAREVEVIHVPGHTPGSIALLDRRRRALYCGDSVSTTPVFIFGEMRSLPALAVSLERLWARRGEFDTLFPSHGESSPDTTQIKRQLDCARRLLSGELCAHAAPPDIPAKLYFSDGAGFFM